MDSYILLFRKLLYRISFIFFFMVISTIVIQWLTPSFWSLFSTEIVKIKVVDKNYNWWRGWKNRYYIIEGTINGSEKLESFKINSKVFRSNRELYDRINKDRVYKFEIYGFKSLGRFVDEIVD